MIYENGIHLIIGLLAITAFGTLIIIGSVYILSKIQMKAWISIIEQFLNEKSIKSKTKTKENEQEKE